MFRVSGARLKIWRLRCLGFRGLGSRYGGLGV